MMPLIYEVDLARGVVVTTARGVVTAEDLEAHIRALAGNPELPRPLRELWDGRQVERLGARGSDMQRLVDAAEMQQPSLRGARVAIVAVDDAVYGMARMAEILSENTAVTIRAFRELGPAERWIDG